MNDHMLVMLVAERLSAEADRLLEELQRRGSKVVRFNFDEFPSRTRAALEIVDGASTAWFDTGRSRWRADEVAAAWLFIPPVIDPPAEIAHDARDLAVSESLAFLEGLWATTDLHWLNHPRAISAASNRLVQMEVARAHGFRVPEALVTTSATEIRAFARDHPMGVVLKDIDLPFVVHEDRPFSSYTQVLDDVLASLDAARFAPVLVQERMAKKHEVRVFVIGDRVLAAGIDTAAHPEVDFRRHRFQVQLWEYDLSSALSRRCLEFARSFDLRYAAIDLAVDPAGEHHFFEVGPTSAWVWVERGSGLPVTARVADELLLASAR